MSQTALDRWIASGDIPTVIAASGRREVPRHLVTQLASEIEELSSDGRPRHPLAVVLRRRRAEPLDLDGLLGIGQRPGQVPRDHETAELRSQAARATR